MKVVSNASPLIALARIGHLDYLHKLDESIHVPAEVHNEVVVAGAGMLGAAAVSKADWIHVSPVRNTADLAKAISKTGLGAGEIGAIVLAKELPADLTLMDEWKGRRLAAEEGLAVVGCIGILSGGTVSSRIAQGPSTDLQRASSVEYPYRFADSAG